jgi:uroporphyrinogen III methyltransferase/synthase
VVYDELCAITPAEICASGRRAHQCRRSGSRANGQDAIGYLLVEKAREGKLVARLRFGDPFVFEPAARKRSSCTSTAFPTRWCPVSFQAWPRPHTPAFPVTYPGGGDTITLVRGFENESRTPPDIDWASLARLEGTIVCYAGAQQLPLVIEALVSHGWPADAEAAVIYNGTLPSQETLSGTMQELLTTVRELTRRRRAGVARCRPRGRTARASALVRLASAVREARARHASARAGARADRSAYRARRGVDRGADDPNGAARGSRPLLRAAAAPEDFDWIIFTSANAVEAFMTALLDGERDVRALKGPRICTSGTATAEKLASFGIKVDLIPHEFRGDAVVSALLALGSMEGRRVLLPRADIGREVIADGLRRRAPSSPK